MSQTGTHNGRQVVRGLALVVAISVFMASRPAPVRAGTYTVRACWGSEDGGWQALPYRKDLETRKGCPWTQVPTMYAGLHAWATKRPFTSGTETGWIFSAPQGTRVTGFSGYSAVIPNVRQIPGQAWQRGIWNEDTGALIAGVPDVADWTWSTIQGFSATRVGLGMRCYMALCGPGIQISGTNAGNNTADWVSFLQITLTLRDDVDPSVVVTQPPPTGWQGNGLSRVSFTATDNVGAAVLYADVDGTRIGTLDRGCYAGAANTSPLPCSPSSPPLSVDIDSAKFAHGMHIVRLRAVDPSGNVAERSYSLLVDHNPPAAPRALTLRGGAAWQAANRFEVSWTNPPDSGESAVNRAEYQLCPASNAPYDESGCVSHSAVGDNLTHIRGLEVPDDGEWRLRVSLRDAAGNGDSDRAATVDGLRLDTNPPEATFLPFDAADPTRVRLQATDGTSGIAAVDVEARRRGEAIWRSLSVDRQSGPLAAVIDDEALPDGRYNLRARIVDRAGNERTTTMLDDGRPMEISLPVRASTSLEVGRSTRVRVKSARGKRIRYRRILVGHPEAGYGRTVSLQGRLRDAAGNPRVGAIVQVEERVDLPGMEWRYLITLRSGATGVFAFRATPGPARKLRFRYPGTLTTRPETDEVELRVRAGATLVPSRDRLRNGQSVVFRGTLLGGPIPGEGKLLALQALTARGWRTFATPRARQKDGHWSYRYHFTGTTSTVRYAFRVLVPTEASYPYAQGTSRVAHVRVRAG
jgi:hypothetical protein